MPTVLVNAWRAALQTRFQFGLFRRRERSADILAQRSRRARQPQRTLGFELSGR